MKKSILPLVVLTSILASCGQQQVASPPQTISESAVKLSEVDKINSLSIDQLKDLLNKQEAWKSANPQANDAESENHFKILLDLSSSPLSAQWSIGDWTKLGPAQGALCNAHFINCGKTRVYKDQAQNWSEHNSGYSNGLNGGKIDAARHTYWNALMTRGVDKQWAQNFSYAHEQDSPPNNAVGWNLRNMDLFNNDQGQTIGSTHPASQYNDSQVEGTIKYYLNAGLLRVADGRLNTAAQGGCNNLVPSNSPEAFVGWACQ